MDFMNVFAHMAIVIVVAQMIATVHVRAQKPTLYFCACCAAVTGRERALLNVLHSVSIWVTTRYALHTPFFVIYLLRIIIEIWIIDTLMSIYTGCSMLRRQNG